MIKGFEMAPASPHEENKGGEEERRREEERAENSVQTEGPKPAWERGIGALKNNEEGLENGDTGEEQGKGGVEDGEDAIETGPESRFDREFVSAAKESRAVLDPILFEVARREGIPFDSADIENAVREVKERHLSGTHVESEKLGEEGGEGVLEDAGKLVSRLTKKYPKLSTAIGAMVLGFTLMRGMTSEAEASPRNNRDIIRVITPIERGVLGEVGGQHRLSALLTERNTVIEHGNALFQKIRHLEGEVRAMEQSGKDKSPAYRRASTDLRRAESELRRIDQGLTRVEKQISREQAKIDKNRISTLGGVLKGAIIWR